MNDNKKDLERYSAGHQAFMDSEVRRWMTATEALVEQLERCGQEARISQARLDAGPVGLSIIVDFATEEMVLRSTSRP